MNLYESNNIYSDVNNNSNTITGIYQIFNYLFLYLDVLVFSCVTQSMCNWLELIMAAYCCNWLNCCECAITVIQMCNCCDSTSNPVSSIQYPV